MPYEIGYFFITYIANMWYDGLPAWLSGAILLVVIAALSYGAYILFSKRLCKDRSRSATVLKCLIIALLLACIFFGYVLVFRGRVADLQGISSSFGL